MKRIIPALGVSLLLAAPAQAQPYDFELPQRWNEDLSPGSHCATPGRTDTYVDATRRWFKQTDAASVGNDTEGPVPVEQRVKEKRVQTLEVSGTFTPKGDLVKNVSRAYGWNYVHEVSWSLNQVVGPYTLDAGKHGRLVWGFTMLDGDAQDVKCSEDQVWEAIGDASSFSVPEARYSELRVEESPL
ncbi:hypothetical protein [Corynebacterium lujinxingii]|uniref:Secreted protein n=1 Tax=Corynebacterium lujinxingii TaxID=2763010 RepID=A0A7H0JY17_9CORY|nr:hypothetical protein [Corynebacterium lujinxingii]MBC3178372.1 hypothetical protein [Corynebacterium lujinxingii]NNO10750.1 hypothetical protein [Corynebacterium lujinxingii]QNP89933.1 hypothetical protein IAU68_09785 [Corynebacterium lujinxingii]